MSTTRTQYKMNDGTCYTIEKTTQDDGTISEKRLEGVKIIMQFNRKEYYPSSAYEGRIYRVTRFSDGVEYKNYLRSFDEYPGCYDD